MTIQEAIANSNIAAIKHKNSFGNTHIKLERFIGEDKKPTINVGKFITVHHNGNTETETNNHKSKLINNTSDGWSEYKVKTEPTKTETSIESIASVQIKNEEVLVKVNNEIVKPNVSSEKIIEVVKEAIAVDKALEGAKLISAEINKQHQEPIK